MTTPTCPTCEVPMTEGYIPERGQRHHHFASWVEGAPEPTWYGTAKVFDRERYLISAYRCPECGRLEIFANRPYTGH
jgi:hypothetical protein